MSSHICKTCSLHRGDCNECVYYYFLKCLNGSRVLVSDVPWGAATATSWENQAMQAAIPLAFHSPCLNDLPWKCSTFLWFSYPTRQRNITIYETHINVIGSDQVLKNRRKGGSTKHFNWTKRYLNLATR
jgi:hypothetical protein